MVVVCYTDVPCILFIKYVLTAVSFVRRKLGLELVPRRGAEAVDPEEMSLVDLYRTHVESAERAAAVSVHSMYFHHP